MNSEGSPSSRFGHLPLVAGTELTHLLETRRAA